MAALLEDQRKLMDQIRFLVLLQQRAAVVVVAIKKDQELEARGAADGMVEVARQEQAEKVTLEETDTTAETLL